MASIRKHGSKWQARIQRRNQSPIAKSFHSKADALRWARATESRLDLGELGPKPTALTLRAAIQRYLEEVTPLKKGAPQELSRGRQIARLGLALKPMDQITPQEIATHRDDRLDMPESLVENIRVQRLTLMRVRGEDKCPRKMHPNSLANLRPARPFTPTDRPNKPRKVTPQIREQVIQLREDGYSWRVICDKVGLNVSTTRKFWFDNEN